MCGYVLPNVLVFCVVLSGLLFFFFLFSFELQIDYYFGILQFFSFLIRITDWLLLRDPPVFFFSHSNYRLITTLGSSSFSVYGFVWMLKNLTCKPFNCCFSFTIKPLNSEYCKVDLNYSYPCLCRSNVIMWLWVLLQSSASFVWFRNHLFSHHLA